MGLGSNDPSELDCPLLHNLGCGGMVFYGVEMESQMEQWNVKWKQGLTGIYQLVSLSCVW